VSVCTASCDLLVETGVGGLTAVAAVQEMWTDDHEQQYQMADTHRISDMRGPLLPQVCGV
jgi:hypothetical protein